MVQEFRERRRAPRVAIVGRVNSKIRPTIEASLVNLSTTGALIEHATLIRPTSRCELLIRTEPGELHLKAKAIRSVVHRSVRTETGATEFIYHTGVEFLDLRPEDQEQLATLLQAFQASGGAAPSGWKVFCLLV